MFAGARLKFRAGKFRWGGERAAKGGGSKG